MQALCPRPDEHAAIRTDLNAIFVSLELSRSTWVITSLAPGSGEKMSKHSVRSGDIAGLLARLSQLQEKARARTGRVFPVPSGGVWSLRAVSWPDGPARREQPASTRAVSTMMGHVPRRVGRDACPVGSPIIGSCSHL